MKHDAITTETLVVSQVRVFRCECGHVLGQVTREALVRIGLAEIDAIEQSMYAAHAKHRQDMSLIVDLGELPQVTMRELESPNAAIEA